MNGQKKLSTRTAVAMGWTVLRYGGDQIFGFIVFAALARSLDPENFGIFIIGLAVAELGRIMAQSGLVSGIARADKLTPALVDTIFWGNLGVATIIAAVCCLASGLIADLMGSPQAASVIAAMGFVVPVTAAGATHMSQHLKNFGHRALAIRSLLVGVVGGGIALAAAYAGWGVWALVVHRFASEIIATLVAWFSFRWKPGWNFSWSVLKQQWALGAGVAGSQLMLTLLFRAQDVIISRFLGVGAVGMFRVASKPVDVVTQGVINCYFAVAPATFSRLKHDEAAFQAGYVRMMGFAGMLLFPALAGLWALIDILLPLVFGEQWAEGVPMARIMCIMAPAYALAMFGDPILNLLGRAGGIMQITLVQLVLTIGLSLLAAPYGLYWFAVACAVRSYATFAFQLVVLQRIARIHAITVLRALAPSAVAALAMGLFIRTITKETMAINMPVGLNLFLTISVLVSAGAGIYGLLLFCLISKDQRAAFVRITRKFAKVSSKTF